MSHIPKPNPIPRPKQDQINTLAQKVMLAFAKNLDIMSFAQHVASHNESEGEETTVGAVLAEKSFDWSEAWWAEHAKRNTEDASQ